MQYLKYNLANSARILKSLSLRLILKGAARVVNSQGITTLSFSLFQLFALSFRLEGVGGDQIRAERRASIGFILAR